MRVKKGDRVRVERCQGTARVVKFCQKYGVYLLDRKMSVRFFGADPSVTFYVGFWTFAPEALTVVEIGGESEEN